MEFLLKYPLVRNDLIEKISEIYGFEKDKLSVMENFVLIIVFTAGL